MNEDNKETFSEAVKTKILNEVWNNRTVCVVLIIATFVSGVNVIFWYNVELFENLELIKLIILAICISFPMLLLCMFLAFILEWHIRDKHVEEMNSKVMLTVAAICAIIFNLQLVILKIVIGDLSFREGFCTNIISYVVVLGILTFSESRKYKARLKCNS